MICASAKCRETRPVAKGHQPEPTYYGYGGDVASATEDLRHNAKANGAAIIGEIEVSSVGSTGSVLNLPPVDMSKFPMPACQGPANPFGFDLIAHLHRQRDFSLRAFGPGTRVPDIIGNLGVQLDEIVDAPDDLLEWVHVAFLAFDGALRAGHSPEAIAAVMKREHEDRAIEHHGENT